MLGWVTCASQNFGIRLEGYSHCPIISDSYSVTEDLS